MLIQFLKRASVNVVGRDMANRMTGPFYDWAAIRRSRKKLQQLDQKHLLINLGCGPKPFKGWVNVDIARGEHVDVVMDARKGLPFQDKSCQAIFCEHVIEHITREEGVELLRECYRVLEPGGVVRMSTPDAEKYLRSYAGDGHFLDDVMKRRMDEARLAEGRIVETRLDCVNRMMREWGQHVWVYDGESLSKLFRKAGFRIVDVSRFGHSMHAQMSGLDQEARHYESLYVEAQR